MTVFTWTWSIWDFIVTFSAELLSLRIVAEFVRVIISTWTTFRVSNRVFTACAVDPSPSWTALSDKSFCKLVSVFTWTRADWDLLLPSNAEDLGIRVVAEFIIVVIGAWASSWINDLIDSAYSVLKIPGRVSLLHSAISLLMMILTGPWT